MFVILMNIINQKPPNDPHFRRNYNKMALFTHPHRRGCLSSCWWPGGPPCRRRGPSAGPSGHCVPPRRHCCTRRKRRRHRSGRRGHFAGRTGGRRLSRGPRWNWPPWLWCRQSGASVRWLGSCSMLKCREILFSLDHVDRKWTNQCLWKLSPMKEFSVTF